MVQHLHQVPNKVINYIPIQCFQHTTISRKSSHLSIVHIQEEAIDQYRESDLPFSWIPQYCEIQSQLLSIHS